MASSNVGVSHQVSRYHGSNMMCTRHWQGVAVLQIEPISGSELSSLTNKFFPIRASSNVGVSQPRLHVYAMAVHSQIQAVLKLDATPKSPNAPDDKKNHSIGCGNRARTVRPQPMYKCLWIRLRRASAPSNQAQQYREKSKQELNWTKKTNAVTNKWKWTKTSPDSYDWCQKQNSPQQMKRYAINTHVHTSVGTKTFIYINYALLVGMSDKVLSWIRMLGSRGQIYKVYLNLCPASPLIPPFFC